MSKGKELLKNTFVYGIGNFGSRLLGFILLPFYTGIFSKSEYGYIDLIMMGSTLFLTVVTLKLIDGVYRFLWDIKDEQEKIEIVSSTLNLLIIIFGVAAVICVLFLKFTHVVFLYAELVFAWLFIRLLSEYIQQISRALGKNFIYSISGIILAVSMLSLNLVFLGIYKWGIFGFLLAMLLSYLMSLGYCVCASSFWKYYRFNIFSAKFTGPLLKYSLPLLPTAICWWFIRVSGRYVLSFFHGLDPVGIYAVSDKLPTLFYMVSMTFYMAWQDSAIKHFHAADRKEFFDKVMNMYVQLGLSAVIIIILFLKPFFALMINPLYHEAHVYVPWLMFAVFVLCLSGLYDVFFMAVKKTNGILYSTLIAAICNVLLNFIFVPVYGLWATTWVTMAAACIILLVRIYQLRQEILIRFDYRQIFLLFICFGMATFSYGLNYSSYIILVFVVMAVLVGINYRIRGVFQYKSS